jgi:hypothetical protein
MNNRKSQFLQAVQSLAPNDNFIFQAAQRIPEEKLPAFPGGVALEFVVAMERFKSSTPRTSTKSRSKSHQHYQARFNQAHYERETFETSETCETETKPGLTLNQAIHVKSAEFWLKLGEPAQALMEMERLPEQAQKHPWALRIHMAVVRAVREMNEAAIQA